MTKLAEIQDAILRLAPQEHRALCQWLEQKELDLESDTPALESEMLQVLAEPMTPYNPQTMRAICERVASEMRRA